MGNLATHDGRGHAGPERRKNRLFVTRNSEYYCRDGSCVAVRDRRTGRFSPTHPAIGKRLAGALRLSPEGGMAGAFPPDALEPGEHLCFSSCDGHLDRDVVTSPLLAIERPPKEVMSRYASGAKAS
jgi:hypothetical protein